ncbi:MAG: amidohydrolase family protein [Geminicoccaceae bacterium]
MSSSRRWAKGPLVLAFALARSGTGAGFGAPSWDLRRAVARLLLAGLVLACGLAQAAEPPVAFVGATVIDGTGRAPVADAVLLIEDERIVAIGPRDKVLVPGEPARIDVAGRWIIPGLIDAHVHFFQSGGLYTRPDVIDLRGIRPYAEELARIKDELPKTLARYVASGVISVIDVGGPDWNLEVRALALELDAAPRVAVAGPLLGTYAPPQLRTDAPPILEIATPEEARAEVRRQLAQGVDLIKIWVALPEADLAPDLVWVRAAIEEAHAGGVRVVAHATQLRVARAVIEAGADVLAHGIDDQPIDDATLALMRERGVIYTPTLMVGRRYPAVFGRHLELTEIERRLGDPEAIASFADLERLPGEALPAWVGRARPRPLDPVPAHNLRRVQAAGITVAAGSDAGNIGTLHGPSLHRELALMVEAGLTPMQAVVAATQGGAALMGRADLGTLEPGNLADLVILDADPLADIRNTRRIWRVVKGGLVLDPEAVVAGPGQD